MTSFEYIPLEFQKKRQKKRILRKITKNNNTTNTYFSPGGKLVPKKRDGTGHRINIKGKVKEHIAF